MKLTDIAKLPAFILGNKLAYINSSTNADYDGENEPTDDLKRAEVILSVVDKGDMEPTHKVVLDIDMPVAIIPSSTEGHFHLYIDKEMPWKDYEKLLTVLGEVGIIERGYANASKRRKHTAVRLPWVKKPKAAIFI